MNPVAAAIAAHFGIQAKQAQIVAVLYAAKGEFVTEPVLLRECSITSIGSLKVHVSVMRHRVRLTNATHCGYRLRDFLVEECRAAILAHADTLSAAAEATRAAA